MDEVDYITLTSSEINSSQVEHKSTQALTYSVESELQSAESQAKLNQALTTSQSVQHHAQDLTTALSGRKLEVIFFKFPTYSRKMYTLLITILL
jgi:hypothetical protein